MKDPRIVLFPGLGANQELFKKQKQEFGDQLLIPDYPVPVKDESLTDYAARWSREFPISESEFSRGPVWLGGLSFGGMLAIELAKHFESRGIPVAGVLLISCPRTKDAIAPRFQTQVSALKLMPEGIVRAGMKQMGVAYFSRMESLSPEDTKSLEAMVANLNYGFFLWSAVASARWELTEEELPKRIPLHQLHGEKDGVIPLPQKHAPLATIVPGGAHLVVYTHAPEVNRWIRERIEDAPAKAARTNL